MSGNVRQKLADAREYAAIDPRFQKNVEALQKVQPEPIQATQIRVRLGATWIPVNIVNRFMHEIFRTPFYYRHQIHAEYSLLQLSGRLKERADIGTVWNCRRCMEQKE